MTYVPQVHGTNELIKKWAGTGEKCRWALFDNLEKVEKRKEIEIAP